METYKTAVQVARMFGVPIPTVRRYIRTGELPAARVGRSYVVSGTDIETFVAARKATREEDRTGSKSGRAHRGPRPPRR